MKQILKEAIDKPYLYIKNYIVTKFNDEFIKLTGYSKNELTEKSVSEIDKMIGIDSQVNLENIDEKSNYCIFNKSLKAMLENTPAQRVSYIKTQNDTLNCIINNLDIGYLKISNNNYKIIDINSMFYDILKQKCPKLAPLSDIIGKDLCDSLYFEESSTHVEDIKKVLKNGKSVIVGINKYIICGEEKYYKITMHPLYKSNKEVTELVVICFDVTNEVKEKNKAEYNLKIEEEFFINITHELKTPLNVIFSANQLMNLYLQNDSIEKNKEAIIRNNNTIKQNCYRLTKLINNIVDISKIESGLLKLNLTNNNIVNIVENIVQSVSEYVKNKGLNIIFDTNVKEKIIALDADKIERVLLNLISNAIKFSDTGQSIYVNVCDKDKFVEISVKDYGAGIEQEYLNVIFDRFQQVDKTLSRNNEGSGIGLSLVKSIVEMHTGEILVESEIGKGSIFRIKLPSSTVHQPQDNSQTKFINNKIEMINIEFSDIYSI